MADIPTIENAPLDDGELNGPVLKRRPMPDDLEMDITPMIDITFLLLIFFLVASIPDSATSVDRPPAVHGTGVDARSSVVVTIAADDGGDPVIYFADGKIESARAPDDPDAFREDLLAYLEAGVAQGKTYLLISADRNSKAKATNRVLQVAADVEGLLPHIGTTEIDEE